MERPKQKPTTKSNKKAKKKATAAKQRGKRTATSKTADKTAHRCRPKGGKLDLNSPEANQQVLQSLFDMATVGKSTTAAIFWAKMRCGMQEKSREKERQFSQAPTIVIRTEKKQA